MEYLMIHDVALASIIVSGALILSIMLRNVFYRRKRN